jgi:glucose/arabinose dehydrogenase
MPTFSRLIASHGIAALCMATVVPTHAQIMGPTVVDPALAVRTVVAGLDQPIHMAFLGPEDFFVLEKATGQVKRVINGTVQSTALDLGVNSASERGLLSIALHPDFPANPAVYLYWTQSSTGADTSDLALVPLLGNRVDRFRWNGSELVFEQNLIQLRAFQADAGQPLRGNHDGGVIRFEPRRAGATAKLYIIVGDLGRRGFLQNNLQGPVPDDQFGGPAPDDAHLSGVVLRLNDDGTTPTDNPFFAVGRSMGGEAGANIQKVFAYGFRNSFGMDFDPVSGELWTQENGDDSFSELNRVQAGHNGGWIQIMGPMHRIDQYKQIETTQFGGMLQQLRWPPTLIADSPGHARQSLFRLPGSHYRDPEFSWKYELPPAGITFMRGRGLGEAYEGNLFLGAARTGVAPSSVPGANVISGHIFRMRLDPDRKHFVFTDPRLQDRVADNLDKHDLSESESLVFGRNFGVGTDLKTGPNGNLFVVSLTDGAVYEIYRK